MKVLRHLFVLIKVYQDQKVAQIQVYHCDRTKLDNAMLMPK